MPPQNNQVPPVPPPPPYQPNQSQPSSPSASNNNVMAILAYLGILIIIPFVTGAKDDPFVKFHLKQGLALIITEFIGFVIGIVPILGWLVGFVIWIFVLVMVITGIINASSGKMKELPIIGSFAGKFNF